MKTEDLEGQGYTHREVTLWLAALIVVMACGILVVTNVVGPWILVVPGPIATIMALMRYRAEAEARKESRPRPR